MKKLISLVVSQSGFAAPVLFLIIASVGLLSYLLISSVGPFQDSLFAVLNSKSSSQAAEVWAFEENFDAGVPTAPSQALLPRNFDYNVTHRTHPNNPDGLNAAGSFGTFPADHDEDCSFDGTNAKQHDVTTTTHRSNTLNPDQSFFVCNNHMMSSMGEVEGYSVTTFWPRQEFDFSSGGILEWDVNLNTQSRNWYEVVIMPKNQFQIAPAIASLPIDEIYPKDRIVLRFGSPDGGERLIAVSNRLPSGGDDNDRNRTQEWQTWSSEYPQDPANTDRRIRRKNRLTLENNRLIWSIQKQDGTFDDVTLNVPEGLPFTRGLVEFKTHAYTPDKDELHHRHTFHWDNIRFNGPKLTPYESFETSEVVKLEGVGSTRTQTINLPRAATNPVLLGQSHFGIKGALKLSLNGNPDINVYPQVFDWNGSCFSDGWGTFRVNINPAHLKVGENTLKWTYAQEPACSSAWWHNYTSIKGAEIQLDSASEGGPVPTNVPTTPIPTINPTVVPTSVPTTTPTLRPTPTPTLVPTPTPTPTPGPTASPVAGGSVIKIYAAGTPSEGVYPTLRLDIKTATNSWKSMKSWRSIQGNAGARQFTEIVYNSPTKVSAQNIRVRFTNDRYNPISGQDRNLIVDRINIDGVDYQTERQTTYSQGSWDTTNGCKAGIKQSEWLHCNGYFEYR